jgi:hypothetical protein
MPRSAWAGDRRKKGASSSKKKEQAKSTRQIHRYDLTCVFAVVTAIICLGYIICLIAFLSSIHSISRPYSSIASLSTLLRIKYSPTSFQHNQGINSHIYILELFSYKAISIPYEQASACYSYELMDLRIFCDASKYATCQTLI